MTGKELRELASEIVHGWEKRVKWQQFNLDGQLEGKSDVRE